jgi:peptidoglycan/LPS O-acetylase OafA/YrhL
MAILLWAGRRRLVAPALVLAVATASLFWFNRDAGWDNWALYFFGSYGLGAAAWWASERKQMSAWLGVMLTVAVAALIVDFRLRIALALAVALLLGFGRRSGLLEKWPDARPLAFLGQISYSLFLVHFPVLLLANTLYAQSGLHSPIATVLGLGLAWAASIGAATLFYRWIEVRSQPAHHHRIGLAGRQPAGCRLQAAGDRLTAAAAELIRQFRALPEERQGLGIGQGLDVLDRLRMDDVAHRQFDDLA